MFDIFSTRGTVVLLFIMNLVELYSLLISLVSLAFHLASFGIKIEFTKFVATLFGFSSGRIYRLRNDFSVKMGAICGACGNSTSGANEASGCSLYEKYGG
jgi:hypothetical protein